MKMQLPRKKRSSYLPQVPDAQPLQSEVDWERVGEIVCVAIIIVGLIAWSILVVLAGRWDPLPY